MSLSPTIIFLLMGVGLTLSAETYSDRYDNVNVDAILSSDRLLRQYMSCVLEKGPCSPDGRYFRDILPDALATNCNKCTEKMKTNVKKVSNHIRKRRPEDWTKFVEKYDADRKYRQSFERFLNE